MVLICKSELLHYQFLQLLFQIAEDAPLQVKESTPSVARNLELEHSYFQPSPQSGFDSSLSDKVLYLHFCVLFKRILRSADKTYEIFNFEKEV